MAEVIYAGRRLAANAAVIAVCGFVVLAIGLAVDPERAWLSYLMAFALAFTVVTGGLIWLLVGYAANARWPAVVRRASEVVVLPMPAVAVLFVPILFGLGWIYPWAQPAKSVHEGEIWAHRAAYLDVVPIIMRAVLYFLIFLVAGLVLRKWSVRRDALEAPPPPDDASLVRERMFASAMLPPVGLAVAFASIDWLMSLGTFSSTMFPVYVLAGGFLGALCVVTIVTARLAREDVPFITPNHFHALGRMLFAFTVFWGYIAFFQAMLVRIANKPDEAVFYLARGDGAWEVFVWILIIGHFGLPFVYLMPKAPKFRRRAMARVAWWLLAMQLVDIYWLVIPSHVQGTFVFHWLDLAALAAVGGTCVAVAAWRQNGVSLLATRDPYFAAGTTYRSPL